MKLPPTTIGLPAPFAVLLTRPILTAKYFATRSEMLLQCEGYKENRMPYQTFYWDHDTRGYEEVGK